MNKEESFLERFQRLVSGMLGELERTDIEDRSLAMNALFSFVEACKLHGNVLHTVLAILEKECDRLQFDAKHQVRNRLARLRKTVSAY